MPEVTQESVKTAKKAQEHTHGIKEKISGFKQAGKG